MGLLLAAGYAVFLPNWAHSQADQGKTECDRLISVLQGKAPSEAYDALQKMQIARKGGQYQACIDAAQSQSLSRAELQVGQVAGMDVFNEKGEQVGDIDRLVRGGDQRIFVLMTYRGPRWPGNKQVAIPLDRLTMHAGRLLLPVIGEKDILAMPAVPQDGGAYQPLGDAQAVSVPQLEDSPSRTGSTR
jgi:hypothetical protein